jgi:hypothetical protein
MRVPLNQRVLHFRGGATHRLKNPPKSLPKRLAGRSALKAQRRALRPAKAVSRAL